MYVMKEGIDWAAWVQAFASVLGILLAVFMPTIQKAAERRSSQLNVLNIFRVAIAEIRIHFDIMEKVLQSRHVNQGSKISPSVLTNVLSELKETVHSQTKMLLEIPALELPIPGLTVMPVACNRMLNQLERNVIDRANENNNLRNLLEVYSYQKGQIFSMLTECENVLDQTEGQIGSHPLVQICNKFTDKLRGIG